MDTVRRARSLLERYSLMKREMDDWMTERRDVLNRLPGWGLRVGGRSTQPSNPTLRKALQLAEIDERHAEALTVVRTIEKMLRRTDALTRHIIKIRFVEGQSITDVAAECGVSRPTIYRRIGEFTQELAAHLWGE